MIRHIGRFLKRLPKYVKFAWQQEDWHYNYLYDLIEMKMKEFLEAQKKDKIHYEKDVKRYIKQLKICLMQMDRFRNCDKYIDFPVEDIEYAESGDGWFIRQYTNEENEKKRLENIKFEEKNFNKFWKNFIKWHRNWFV